VGIYLSCLTIGDDQIDRHNLRENNGRDVCQEAGCLRIHRSHINLNVPSLHRLEVQADVQKEIFPKDTASLGAISDNASTRAMAGSIISSYNPQDRYVKVRCPGEVVLFDWILGLQKFSVSR
jgi:hypothetical protein